MLFFYIFYESKSRICTDTCSIYTKITCTNKSHQGHLSVLSSLSLPLSLFFFHDRQSLYIELMLDWCLTLFRNIEQIYETDLNELGLCVYACVTTHIKVGPPPAEPMYAQHRVSDFQRESYTINFVMRYLKIFFVCSPRDYFYFWNDPAIFASSWPPFCQIWICICFCILRGSTHYCAIAPRE